MKPKEHKMKVYLNPDDDKCGTDVQDDRRQQLIKLVSQGMPIGKLKRAKLFYMETGEYYGDILTSLQRIIGGWKHRAECRDFDHRGIEVVEIIYNKAKSGRISKLVDIHLYRSAGLR